jgi:hypothetical protein
VAVWRVTRFEEGQSATNPEELIGAAHAGCFTIALTAQLRARESRRHASIPKREGEVVVVANLELDSLGSSALASKKVLTFQKTRTVIAAITTSFATETS